MLLWCLHSQTCSVSRRKTECEVKDGLLLAFLQNCSFGGGRVSRKAVPLHWQFRWQQIGLNRGELRSDFPALSSEPLGISCWCNKALKSIVALFALVRILIELFVYIFYI